MRRARGNRARRPALAAVLVLFACGSEPAPPDVLLVALDTVRADRTSTYGYDRETSIQLSALAAAGVVFEDATAPAPWTVPSHASLFTGEPPWVHGAHMVAPRSGGDLRFGMSVSRMRDDLPTLAERFGAAGYRTVGLVANDWLGPELGLMRGFESARLLASDAEVLRAAVETLEGGDGRPLFLFVNLMSAHAPYHAGPGPWGLDDPDWLSAAGAPPWVRPYLTGDRPGVNLGRSPGAEGANGITHFLRGDLEIPAADLATLERLYVAGVRGADFALGRVLDAWSGSRPGGVVAVTSDHGEAFGEHGLIEHRASVYPEVLRVPLVVAAPGRLPAGVRVSTPVQLQDLHPTLLELAGLEVRPGSLVAVARGAPRPEPIAAVAYRDPYWAEEIGGRFDADWRLYREGDAALVWGEERGGAARLELYDLAADPGMRINLAASRPERAEALLADARSHFPARAIGAAPPVEISDDLRERLRHLGYAD